MVDFYPTQDYLIFFRFFHRKCKEANKQEKSGLGNYFAEADVF
jgi:hypothetical protein